MFFPSQETRLKPDIAATDNNMITGVGGFGFPDGQGNVRFAGTSSAAPHAAAVAALILSASPTLTPAQLRDVLSNHAVDLGDAGADNTFGAGRIDAFASVQSLITSVEADDSIIPSTYSLDQNFPNPFNPETWLPFYLASDTNVKIRIHNLLGETVRTLELGHKSAGYYDTHVKAAYWDGKDNIGQFVSSGFYFYTLETSDFTATKKMVIVK